MSFLLSRKLFFGAFATLYLVFVSYFGIALNNWDYNKTGRCYHYDHVALPDSSHPDVDKAYLVATCVFMFVLLFCCVILGKPATEYLRRGKTGRSPDFGMWLLIWIARIFLLITALLQYPLHLYMVVSLRVANDKYLQGDSENTWGFGQIVALILLIPVFKECGAVYISKFSPDHIYRHGAD